MLLHETDKISVDHVLQLVDAFLTETRDEFGNKMEFNSRGINTFTTNGHFRRQLGKVPQTPVAIK